MIKSVETTKFLGVILDNKLSWKDHYEQLKCKILRNYAPSMLSSKCRRKLQTLQNKCVKLLNINKSVDYLYVKHRVLKLDHVIDLEQKKLGYKLIHGELPPNLEKLILTDSFGTTLKKHHCYNTRGKQLPNLPNHISKTYNESFLLQSLKKFNGLDPTVKTCKTLNAFARKVKKTAIMSYNV